MKKIVTTILVFAMMLSAVACGNDESESESITTTVESDIESSLLSEESKSEGTQVTSKVTTSEETSYETSQNTEIPTEPTRTLTDEEAEMSRLRDEEIDDDGEEEYEEPSGNGNGNGNSNGGNGNSGNNNGGNGGTTSIQPTYATEPDVGPDVSKPKGHWETRVISEAWDETVVDQEAWDEEVKVYVGQTMTQNDTGTDMTGWSSSQQLNWCYSHNCPNHCDDYDPSQPGYCACNVTIKKVYETQIVHHDAVTHVVHHDAVTEEVWVED